MIHTESLREQLYAHLREELRVGRLAPGAAIDLNHISSKLGVSRTPLRDALIQLESEGFVTIQPRRGVVVRKLTLAEVRDLYEIVGALEGATVERVAERLGAAEIARLKALNAAQLEALAAAEFDRYYQLNLEFHGVFLELSENRELLRLLERSKQRLYDFPRHAYLEEWERENCREHERFIAHLEAGNAAAAATLLRDEHWSFGRHAARIAEFYGAG